MVKLWQDPSKDGQQWNPPVKENTDVVDTANKEEEAKVTNEKAQKKPTPIAPKQEDEETVMVSKKDLESIMGRLEELEGGEKEKDPKARYEWPRKYGYKLRNGEAVCSYTSVKRDPRRWRRYKNEHGHYVSNQDMVLKLGNWKEEKVEAESFLSDFERSEKTEASVIHTKDWQVKYAFEDTPHGSFEVLDQVIN